MHFLWKSTEVDTLQWNSLQLRRKGHFSTVVMSSGRSAKLNGNRPPRVALTDVHFDSHGSPLISFNCSPSTS